MADGRRTFRIGLIAGSAIALVSIIAPAKADSVATSTEGGYARLLFTLTPAAHATTSTEGGALTIGFDRKVTFDPASLAQSLPVYISSARADADGKTFHFALAQRLRVHASAVGEKIAIDLAPASFAGTPPDLPQPPVKTAAPIDPASLAALKVRAGAYQNFTRLVFDWTKQVPYSVFPGLGKLTIRFDALAKPDFSALLRQTPPWVKNAAWRIEGKAIVVEFETDQASGYHDFRDGTRVVLDVLAPKTDADAYAPPGTAKVKPTPLAAKTNAVTSAQAQVIASAAAKLAGNSAAPVAPAPVQKPAPQTPAAASPPPAAATPAPAAPQADPTPAEGKLTRDGAVMIFAGASRRGSAVFMRGMTAWIVLQDAAALDAAKLKAQLGTFPDAVEASSGSGVSVLRITLKQPEQIAAYTDGSNLKVVIAGQVTPNATSIGFARNQDDATHSSMTTLLPGATRAVNLVDPVAGDQLILIPAAAGRAMSDERSYVEFQSLQTASGLVLVPFVDDLSVAIDTTRVTITHKGGLSLTPPTMPVADSPAALARNGGGPSYLDFNAWSRIQGGSFLATERRLGAAIARLKPEDANHARLKLARFYLANGFAAETLGLVKLMQAADPALQSDRQLLTMRAAADLEMGRLRDAHNDLAATQFDGDRHAALWRGLIETALEDWNDAQADLDRAGPVLHLYPKEWQSRARLATAEAALGRNHLEIADAALARLPADLPQPLMIAAQLERARLYAAENRKDAAQLFTAVEKSGDERQAARAVFYRVNAGLAAGTLSSAGAIAELEKLRFRWRGDALEMKTLRKLSALYFARAHWREGLRTLRLAAQSFPGDDTARQAQDDMRAAFVNLFLKGQADKISPVEALSLFYDNLDQTPIGPEGDEMIRRMADRLVAVDLLGPAADLLKYQVDKRLDGVARAQVATKLAGIFLMDRKPELALDEIRATAISTLPDDVGHQRMLIEARALCDLKRYDDALDMIAVDKADDTARLRADIYWQGGQWAMAGKMAEDALGPRWSDTAPLGENDRGEVMRAAIAYSLANDETSLDRLRAHFAPKMKSTPDATGFEIVSQRIDAHGVAFRDAAAQVASIDTLQSFMKDIRAQSAAARTN
ncbi:MAG TPA: hypothetical protein VHZ29_03575 [Rhizomicrobium sp.]|jgi:hypothetical protein|nr:hypothetical protein [Rhizomicrobium sp.]